MSRKNRPYLFYGTTAALCSTCLARVEAKILFKDGAVFLEKWCPEHLQHSCLTAVEITGHCNLRCPVCYAESGPERQTHRTLDEVEAMLDAIVANEGETDVVQISGGEPTLHPDSFAVLDAAKARPIKHLTINTNGLRLAREPEFAARLAAYKPGVEIHA